MIILITFLGSALSLVYLKFTRAEYKSSATIIIESSQSDPTDNFFNPGFETTIHNHIEHLKSYKISKLVLEYLEDHKSNYPFEFEIFSNKYSNIYGSERAKVSWLMSRLNVNRLSQLADIIEISFMAYSPEEAASIANVYQQIYIDENLNFVENELIRLKKYLIDKNYEKEKLLLEAEDAMNAFKRRENINLLTEQTREAINTIANINSKKTQYQIELESALESKKAVEEQIRSNQDKLSNSNININTSYFRQLTDEIAQKRSRKLKMDAQLENLGLSRETFKATLDGLENEIQVLENQLREQTKLQSGGTNTEGSFKLGEELQMQYLNLDIKIKSLQQSIKSIDEHLETHRLNDLNLPDKELQLARLQREVSKHMKISSMLVDELEQTEIKLSSRKNNVKIIDKALVNYGQVHPKNTQTIALGTLGSLFFIVSIIFLFEYVDNTIKSDEEIQYYGLNRLGLIPRIVMENTKSPAETPNSFRDRLVVHLNSNSMVSESYKSLRTNLSFHLKKNPNNKSFLVTSCGPQEGKSTTISNTAISFALQGKKVLLIDADLRKPVLHNIFELDKKNGFVDLLMNDISLNETLKATFIDNLFVITAGMIPPNPSELLSLDSIDQYIETCKQEFDVILFDTPPIIAVTDAAILSEKVDNTILIVRANVTDRDMINEAITKLTIHKNNLIGCVLNDFNLERHYGYRYQYYNYYHDEDGKKIK